MKILELCHFTSGACGVWERVKRESILLAEKGHEVRVFSSNISKGSDKNAEPEEKIGEIKITRFPYIKLGGESFLSWNFEKDAIKYSPEVIIAHSYRHLHTTKAIHLAKKIGAKVFLVTHAPFERSSTRSLFERVIVKLYDYFIGRTTLKKFTKVIAITQWEIPYLLELGVPKEKIEYIPNGIPEEFFKIKPNSKEKKEVIYMGRISPIKDLETLIASLSFLKDKKIKLRIYGPSEDDYLERLNKIISDLNLQSRIIIINSTFNKTIQIKELDSAFVYVLSSKSEGMPQTLIEAMARKRVVIASNNKGNMDLISDKKNGILFEVGSPKDLAEKIEFAFDKENKKTINKIRENAQKSVERFKWNKLINSLDNLFYK
ncbi:MAG: glycosyltransferase family 4 protein [Nanoarchaeota archaeon]